METKQQRKPGGHWSAANPIPTVQKFIEMLDQNKRERDRQIEEANKAGKQGQLGENGEAVPHKAALFQRSRRRRVTDPTSGREVEIDDVNKDFLKAVKDPQLCVPNANLDKPTPVKTDPSQTQTEYKHNQDITAPPDPIAEGSTSDVPIHGEKTNILFHPTPSVSYEPMFKVLGKRAEALCTAIFAVIIVSGRILGGNLMGFILLAACVTSAVWLWVQDVIRRGRDLEWSSEQHRGEIATANLLPESVEWMNSFLAILWGLLNPSLFASVADTLEDVMQASVPGVVENVRVADIDQGSNPIRILSLRSLPRSEVQDLNKRAHEHNDTKSPGDAVVDEEEVEYYNLECSFAYHAKPSHTNSSSKARNMHMLLIFYLGVKGLFGVPLPVFVELIELVGTVRLRLQMIPEPPFAKNLTFSLMGLPHIRAGCVPMVRRGVNILNLPLISNFVNYAIGAAASIYVAPKSMSIDLRMLLQGDDIQKDTLALGIMWVRIHRAIGLSKQDKRGSEGGGSDPYINLSFSKYGKPMYCTRVITDDLNPVWEEAAALLVTPELIKADEQLSVELWDSDRNTADDIVGKIHISIREMIQHPRKMYYMISKLRGMDAGSEMPGELHWEVGYFGKSCFREALRTDGKDHNLPQSMKDNSALQDDNGQINSEEQDAVVHTPPDPLWPSGICSVVIHQIVNLEFANLQGSHGHSETREFDPAKPYGENTEEEGKHLPTSYCTILINDQLVYRTRAKAVSSKPIFNAGTERFIRDWRSAIITLTVRDQRHREHDPILGIVPLRLSDILQTSSQATRWYALDGGIGFGRARISLLFRSVEIRLPVNMLGWDVGTFEIVSDRIVAMNYTHQVKLRLRDGESGVSLPREICLPLESDTGRYFDLASGNAKKKARLPVKHRYRAPVIFEFHASNPPGYAILWLHELVDNEDTPVNLPIWTTRNKQRLTQNYIAEHNWQEKKVPGLEDLTEIGRLKFNCRFTPGLSELHERVIVSNESRESYETWEACISEGVRDHVSVEVSDTIRMLHDASMVQERDKLRGAEAETLEKEASKSGRNWTDIPKDDPHCFAIEEGPNNMGDGELESNFYIPGPSAQAQSDSQDGEDNARDREITDNTDPSDYSGDSVDHSHEDEGSFLISSNRSLETREERERRIGNKANKRTEQRKQRGMMQWKPVRNVVFAKDEATFALNKVRQKFMGGLTGRESDVETELG